MMDKLDMVDKLQELGPVYVYERGDLYMPGCRSRHKQYKRTHPLSPNIPSCHQVHDDRRVIVSSLFSICIEFVAENISIVESLVGFPDIVGVEIFKSVSKQSHLQNYKTDRVHSILQLFTNSYQDAVLSALNLTTFPRLLLEDCLDLICSFTFLYKLDVGDQQLGDKHVLWNAVGEMKK
jgi:hypothetical protein